MRRTVAGFVAGLILATAGAAGAAAAKILYLHDGDSVRFDGVRCDAKVKYRVLLCARSDGRGYAMAFSRFDVYIVDQNGKRVLYRVQP